MVGDATVVLHVTPSFAPNDASKVTKIWLLAVTALVFTTSVVAPARTDTLPAAAEPHAAGDKVVVQSSDVAYALALISPVHCDPLES